MNGSSSARRGPRRLATRLAAVLCAAAAAFIFMGTGRGGRHVKQGNLSQALKAVDDGKPGAMDAFVARLLSESREAPASLVALTASRDEDVAEKAREAVLLMEDTIVRPVADTGPEIGVADRLWLTEAAVRAEVGLRRALASSLEKTLGNKNLLPPPFPPGMAEETPPPVRACDEAYLQLRTLLHADEGAELGVLNRGRFLREPFDARDQEIRKFRSGRGFTNFMSESPGEAE